MIRLKDSSVRIIQGVRDVFEITDAENKPPSSDDRSKASKIVLIGRGLGRNGEPWRGSFLSHLGCP
jgi:hypothetical protein